MGCVGSSWTLSIAPGVEQLSAVYALATFAAAASALALSQPRPTRPVLACVLTAASVWAGVGAGAVCGAAGAGVAGAVAEAVGAGVAGVVAARSASGTTPFCAVGGIEGVAAPVAVPDGVPEGVAVPLGVPLGVPRGLTWVALLSSAWT